MFFSQNLIVFLTLLLSCLSFVFLLAKIKTGLPCPIFFSDVKSFYIHWYRRLGDLIDPCGYFDIPNGYNNEENLAGCFNGETGFSLFFELVMWPIADHIGWTQIITCLLKTIVQNQFFFCAY